MFEFMIRDRVLNMCAFLLVEANAFSGSYCFYYTVFIDQLKVH